MSANQTLYVPDGRVLRQFWVANDPVQGIMGPFGSGKTSAVVNKIMKLAFLQQPSVIDGVRYTRFVAVRNTYRELAKTTIPTWTNWFPKDVGEWTGGNNEPAIHKIKLDRGDVKVDFEMWFMALGDHSAEDALKGVEVTGGWLNEADLLDPGVYTYLVGRLGRYPGMKHGGPRQPDGKNKINTKVLLMDYNAPDIENYLYQLMEEERPDEVGFYRQPGGLDPDAENLRWLPGRQKYYQQIATLNAYRPWWVRRNVDNQYGYSRDGKPVHELFDDRRHVAAVPLPVKASARIVVGLDAGRTPAAVATQRDPVSGQVRALRELVCDNMGALEFGKRLRAWLGEFVPQDVEIVGIADPASANKNDMGEETWIDAVSEVADLRIEPAFTNDPQTRWAAVDKLLAGTVHGGAPEFIIDPSCRVLIKGYAGGYRFKKILGHQDHYADQADKSGPFSHPADASQYAAMEIVGENAMRGRGLTARRSRASRRAQANAASDYDEFALRIG